MGENNRTINFNKILSLSLLFWLSVQNISTTTVKEATQQVFGTSSPMVAVIQCESGYRQYNEDGTVLVSSTSDIGIGQLNAPTWRSVAKGVGIDITQPVGNLLWTKVLYDSQGLKPWNSSKKCWSKLLDES